MSYELRPYQVACNEGIAGKLSEHDSTLAVLATGLGKTVIFAHVIRDWKSGGVLVLAHRDELIQQAVEKIEAVCKFRPFIEKGKEHRIDRQAIQADPCPVVVSSVQTMYRPRRHRKFNPDQFSLIITDEAHHATARTYRDAYNYFKKNESIKHLGVTATPRRADQSALGKVFESVAFDYGIEPAVDDGWLVPVEQKIIQVEGLDFSDLNTKRNKLGENDFTDSDISRILTEEKPLHEMAAASLDISGSESGIVFCAGVHHAKLLATVLNRYRPGCAQALDGKTEDEERKAAVKRFKDGDLQFLCNCGLFLEGFDAPNASVIIMGRPTKSLTLYTQCIGRGTRPLPGVVDGLDTAELRRQAIQWSAKPKMKVLDFVGNSGKHKIVQAIDVLGGKFDEDAKREAQKNLQLEGGGDINEALLRGELEKELQREHEERRKFIKAKAVSYRALEVSPFGSRGNKVKPVKGSASPGQRNYVASLANRLGRPFSPEKLNSLSGSQAGALINKFRKELGL